MIYEDARIKFYVDGGLFKRYERIRYLVLNKDWDWLTVIDGTEGSGKSVLAQQLA